MATRNASNARHTGTTTQRRSAPRQVASQELDDGGYLDRCNQQFKEIVEDREGQAALLALALGFGVGFAIGYAIGDGERPHRWTDRIAAEGLGHRILEGIDRLLPEAISKRLG